MEMDDLFHLHPQHVLVRFPLFCLEIMHRGRERDRRFTLWEVHLDDTMASS